MTRRTPRHGRHATGAPERGGEIRLWDLRHGLLPAYMGGRQGGPVRAGQRGVRRMVADLWVTDDTLTDRLLIVPRPPEPSTTVEETPGPVPCTFTMPEPTRAMDSR